MALTVLCSLFEGLFLSETGGLVARSFGVCFLQSGSLSGPAIDELVKTGASSTVVLVHKDRYSPTNWNLTVGSLEKYMEI